MSSTAAFDHLCYWYPEWSGPRPAALFDVNLELQPGLTVVGGDSGAGKSTLLRLLNGLIPHFHGGRIAGRATVAGLDVLVTPTRELARRVGFVFQESQAGFVRGTVAREVGFGPENLGFSPGSVEEMVNAALHRVGIGEMGGRRLSTLSGGERQRVALAGALAAAPEIVALDEPTSQLDEAGVVALRAILDDLASSGHAVVVAEHRMRRLAGASRFVMVDGGQLCEARPASMGSVLPRRSIAAPGKVLWALEGVTAGVAGQPVIEAVDLAGHQGEILVLTGPNGAGKTTLLRTIAGLLPPLAGRVDRGTTGARDSPSQRGAPGQRGSPGQRGAPSRRGSPGQHGAPSRRGSPGQRGAPSGSRIAYLPQDPGTLLHRRSVLAEVAQTLRWSQCSDDPMRILDQLGLAGLAGRDPRDLSTGQRQRAALATVLVGRPALALLDEPTRGMDAASRMALAETLRALAEDGCSVVLATHDAELAVELGDRVVLIDGGRALGWAAAAPTGAVQ